MSLSGQPPPGDSYRSVNMPAVVGAIVVFLVVVIVWVIASSDDDSGTAAPTTLETTTTSTSVGAANASTPAPPTSAATTTTTTTSTSVPTTTTPPTTAPPTTTPATTTPPTTAAETTVPGTSAPPTTQATTTTTTTTEPESGDRRDGDLGVPGTPISDPPCRGDYITIVAASIGDAATTDSMTAALEEFPESNYLLTEESCRSFRSSVDGEPIYVIFYGPYGSLDDACEARERGRGDAYPKVLTNGHGPDRGVTCDDDDDDDDDD